MMSRERQNNNHLVLSVTTALLVIGALCFNTYVLVGRARTEAKGELIDQYYTNYTVFNEIILIAFLATLIVVHIRNTDAFSVKAFTCLKRVTLPITVITVLVFFAMGGPAYAIFVIFLFIVYRPIEPVILLHFLFAFPFVACVAVLVLSCVRLKALRLLNLEKV